MEASTLPANYSKKYNSIRWKVIFLSGLLVGTADLLAAFISFYINTGKSPVPIVSKFIASGVFGRAALKGGAEMIAAGIFFHYIIAVLFTIFFFWLYQRWAALSKNRVITGIVYGIFAWTIMSLIVVPLSKTPPLPASSVGRKLIAILILITMIGLPLSFIAKSVTKKSVTEL